MLTKHSGTPLQLHLHAFDSRLTAFRVISSEPLLKVKPGMLLTWKNIQFSSHENLAELC